MFFTRSLGRVFLCLNREINMPNTKKLQTVEELREKIKKAKSITFADYLGLSADNINDLRAKALENDTEVEVAKNTLLKVALKEENIDTDSLENDLKGPTAAFFSYGDPIAVIKTIFAFAKTNTLPRVKAAIVDGKYNNAQQTEILSNLPSRDELIAQTVWGLKSPLSGLVNTLGGVQRKFVYALSAIKDKK